MMREREVKATSMEKNRKSIPGFARKLNIVPGENVLFVGITDSLSEISPEENLATERV